MTLAAQKGAWLKKARDDKMPGRAIRKDNTGAAIKRPRVRKSITSVNPRIHLKSDLFTACPCPTKEFKYHSPANTGKRESPVVNLPPLGHRCDRHTVENLVGVGVAAADVGELQRGSVAVGGKYVVVMSEWYFGRITWTRPGVHWQTVGCVDERVCSKHLDPELQIGAVSRRSENTGIKIK